MIYSAFESESDDSDDSEDSDEMSDSDSSSLWAATHLALSSAALSLSALLCL